MGIKNLKFFKELLLEKISNLNVNTIIGENKNVTIIVDTMTFCYYITKQEDIRVLGKEGFDESDDNNRSDLLNVDLCDSVNTENLSTIEPDDNDTRESPIEKKRKTLLNVDLGNCFKEGNDFSQCVSNNSKESQGNYTTDCKNMANECKDELIQRNIEKDLKSVKFDIYELDMLYGYERGMYNINMIPYSKEIDGKKPITVLDVRNPSDLETNEYDDDFEVTFPQFIIWWRGLIRYLNTSLKSVLESISSLCIIDKVLFVIDSDERVPFKAERPRNYPVLIMIEFLRRNYKDFKDYIQSTIEINENFMINTDWILSETEAERELFVNPSGYSDSNNILISVDSDIIPLTAFNDTKNLLGAILLNRNDQNENLFLKGCQFTDSIRDFIIYYIIIYGNDFISPLRYAKLQLLVAVEGIYRKFKNFIDDPQEKNKKIMIKAVVNTLIFVLSLKDIRAAGQVKGGIKDISCVDVENIIKIVALKAVSIIVALTYICSKIGKMEYKTFIWFKRV